MSEVVFDVTPVEVVVDQTVAEVVVTTGPAGPAGVVTATSPITYNSGTQTIAFDQTAQNATNDNRYSQTSLIKKLFAWPSNGMDTYPRWVGGSNTAVTNRQVQWATITPIENITVSKIQMQTFATAAAGLTLARMGLYTISGSTLTLVAQTANDTTLFTSTYTAYERSFDTTGGYPATYNLVAGQTYAIAYLCVGTTMPTLVTIGSTATLMGTATSPAIAYVAASQNDLPATYTPVSNNVIRWARIS